MPCVVPARTLSSIAAGREHSGAHADVDVGEQVAPGEAPACPSPVVRGRVWRQARDMMRQASSRLVPDSTRPLLCEHTYLA
jgi:hypothetical protein